MGYYEKKLKLTREVIIAADYVWKKEYLSEHAEEITKELISKCRNNRKWFLRHLPTDKFYVYSRLFRLPKWCLYIYIYSWMSVMCTSISICDYAEHYNNEWLTSFLTFTSDNCAHHKTSSNGLLVFRDARLIDFKGMSPSLGLFHALILGNHINCAFTLTFFVQSFLKSFFFQQ